MPVATREWQLAARPHGEPTPDDFRLVDQEHLDPTDGQVVVRMLVMSVDPYMRGRMRAGKSYAAAWEVGETMKGGAVGRVVASRAPDVPEGALVLTEAGWRDVAVLDAAHVRVLPELPGIPPSYHLGVLGMPGLTAYAGLLAIGRPLPGETVVVAAATGPVGSAVGQIARIKGARAVGIAGGPDKARALAEEFGFDAAVDHRSPEMAARLKEACPKGIDVYFENVGGAVWDAVFPLLNDFSRIPVCGLVAQYNMTELPPGPDRTPVLMRAILSKRLLLRGFIVSDFASQHGEFQREVGAWLRDGKIKYREDVVEGLENAPQAFIGLLQGKNFGKLLIKVS